MLLITEKNLEDAQGKIPLLEEMSTAGGEAVGLGLEICEWLKLVLSSRRILQIPGQ
jgi:hypothetical protein